MKSMKMRLLASSLTLLAVAACAEDPVTIPTGSPLAGLSQSSWTDSTTTNNNPADGPGYFHGTIVGQSPPGAGNDSLATAPRIAGAVVTIYARKANTGDAVEPGDAKGSVTTGSDGKFTLPTLPAGQYVVTVVPPGNIYHGVYVWGTLNQHSSTYPWWVVLHKK
jgi:hypothetical protein